jgi:gluconolactonase
MSRRWYVVGLLGLAALAYIASVVGPEKRPSGDPGFLSPDAELELLVDGDDEDLTEGVVVTCDRRVLFSEMPKRRPSGGRPDGRILEYNPDTQAISVFRSPSNGANGNRMDLACRLLTAERHRLVRTDMATGRVEVVVGSGAVGEYDALNDIAVDLKRRIYVTHPRYGADEPSSLREPGVYRIDPDGRVTRVISDAARPNGIAICADERHIAVGSYDFEADTAREMALLRYDLAPDGTAANLRVLVDYAPQHGPDGLVCDTEGNLWVAVRDSGRPGIYAYSVADGVATERAYIPTPELPTNVHFGRGDAANYLYVTAGSSLYGIRVGKRGHHLQGRPSATRSRSKTGVGASDTAGSLPVRPLARATTRRRLGPPDRAPMVHRIGPADR